MPQKAVWDAADMSKPARIWVIFIYWKFASLYLLNVTESYLNQG
jgi:hypothetical protein